MSKVIEVITLIENNKLTAYNAKLSLRVIVFAKWLEPVQTGSLCSSVL